MLMGKIDVSIVILIFLSMTFAAFLAIVSESRIDAYVSTTILIYFVYTTIDPHIRRYSNLKPIDITLIAIFTLIVAIRILDVLEVI